MCGLSTVVTPAGASLTMYREIRPYANSIWDDNNNNKTALCTSLCFRRRSSRYVASHDTWPGTFAYYTAVPLIYHNVNYFYTPGACSFVCTTCGRAATVRFLMKSKSRRAPFLPRNDDKYHKRASQDPNEGGGGGGVVGSPGNWRSPHCL